MIKFIYPEILESLLQAIELLFLYEALLLDYQPRLYGA